MYVHKGLKLHSVYACNYFDISRLFQFPILISLTSIDLKPNLNLQNFLTLLLLNRYCI